MLRNKDFNLGFGVLDKKKLNLTTQPLRASSLSPLSSVTLGFYIIIFSLKKPKSEQTQAGLLCQNNMYYVAVSYGEDAKLNGKHFEISETITTNGKKV